MKVNEIFGPTIQGEGPTAGVPVMFLRLATCNLHCVWCDTPYTWNWVGTPFAHPNKFEYNNEVHQMDDVGIAQTLYRLGGADVMRLVVSGGEPLIQQKSLVSLFQALTDLGWAIEVETNGTIAPTEQLNQLVTQFNCSPKLSNSGDSATLRIRQNALHTLASNPKTCFKFVIANQKDIDEVLEYVSTYNMQNVYLMPLGMTVEQLNQTRQQTKLLCKQHNFKFCERLHVTTLGGGRAV